MWAYYISKLLKATAESHALANTISASQSRPQAKFVIMISVRKIFLFMMVSADGYFEGVGHDLSWHNVDGEFADFAVKQLDETDTLIFGRRTYELMACFWPTKLAKQSDPATAERMNKLPKIVCSHRLKTADWQNSRVINTNVPQQIENMKRQAGKPMAIFGSSNLCHTLIKAGLLDEIRLMVNPVILGKGTRLFADLAQPCSLTLLSCRQFASGNVLLRYAIQ